MEAVTQLSSSELVKAKKYLAKVFTQVKHKSIKITKSIPGVKEANEYLSGEICLLYIDGDTDKGNEEIAGLMKALNKSKAYKFKRTLFRLPRITQNGIHAVYCLFVYKRNGKYDIMHSNVSFGETTESALAAFNENASFHTYIDEDGRIRTRYGW